MKKILYTIILLFTCLSTFGQVWTNTGTSNLQRTPTAKGYMYRNNIGALAPNFVYWYTKQQIDSLLGTVTPDSSKFATRNYVNNVFLPYSGAVNALDMGANNIYTSATIQVRSGVPYPVYGINPADGFYSFKSADEGAQMDKDEIGFNQYRSTETPAFLHLKAAALTAGLNRNILLPDADGTVILNNGLASNVILGDGTYAPYSGGGGGGTTTNPVTFNNGGAGAASGTTFNGSSPITISYNTIGAQVAGTYLTPSSTNSVTNKDLTSGTNTFPTFNQSTTGNSGTVTSIGNLTGDVTSVNRVTTLSTVNSNVGTFGDATHVAAVTVNAKGQITGVTSVAITGGSSVTSVSGTTNRITSTGGTTPVIDISSTFEALLGKVANPLSQFASTTSTQLAGVLSDETGTSGGFVRATSPALTTPTSTVNTPGDSTLNVATMRDIAQRRQADVITFDYHFKLNGSSQVTLKRDSVPTNNSQAFLSSSAIYAVVKGGSYDAIFSTATASNGFFTNNGDFTASNGYSHLILAGTPVVGVNGDANTQFRIKSSGGAFLFNNYNASTTLATLEDAGHFKVFGDIYASSNTAGTAGTDSVAVWHSGVLRKISATYYGPGGGGGSSPTTTLGDMIYRGASVDTRLPGNTTTTTKFLTSTGTGSASAAPGYFDLFNTPNTFNQALTVSSGNIVATTGDLYGGSMHVGSSGGFFIGSNFVISGFGNDIYLNAQAATGNVVIQSVGGGQTTATFNDNGTINLPLLTATTTLGLDGSKNIVSITNTGTGNSVRANSPALVTPALGTPSALVLTNATGLPLGSTGVTGILTGTNGGTGVNNSTRTITIGGNVVFSGAFAATITSTATSNSTLPAGTHTIAAIDLAQTFSAQQSGTTPTLGDNTTKFATTAFVQTATAVAGADVSAQTAANSSIATYTTTASGAFRIGCYGKVTAIATDVLEFQVTYTDADGTAQTQNFFPQGATSALLATTGNYVFPTMDIQTNSGTAITVKTILTTGGGTITYRAGATITKLR